MKLQFKKAHKNLHIASFLIAFSLYSTNAYSDYVVVSDIQGEVCSGFFIETCSMKKIDAVGDGSGTLFTPADHFESVTDHREKDDRCWIRLKGNGLINEAISFFSSTQFYSLENGKHKKIDPEYLTFKCLKL